MKIPSLLCGSAFASVLAVSNAGAQTAARTPTVVTPTYTEQNVAGDQVVAFTGDELAGVPGGACGDVLRRPPGVIRVGLIRPRLNFLSELVKSVENL